MMKLNVAIAILSVFFIGQSQLQAQGTESPKKEEVTPAKVDESVKDEVRPAKTDEAAKEESAKKEAVKGEFDETMKERKAELKEAAGNDPEMKDEIQAKMKEEKQAQKEVLKARYWEEQHSGKSGNKEKKDRVQTPAAADAVDGARTDGTLSTSGNGKAGAEKAKPVSKEVKSKEAKKAKPAGKKDASE